MLCPTPVRVTDEGGRGEGAEEEGVVARLTRFIRGGEGAGTVEGGKKEGKRTEKKNKKKKTRKKYEFLNAARATASSSSIVK